MNTLTKAPYMGFAAGRNRKSQEERSPEGLEAGEKELAHSKNPFRNEKCGGGLLLIYNMSHDPKNRKLKLEGQCLLTLPKT